MTIRRSANRKGRCRRAGDSEFWWLSMVPCLNTRNAKEFLTCLSVQASQNDGGIAMREKILKIMSKTEWMTLRELARAICKSSGIRKLSPSMNRFMCASVRELVREGKVMSRIRSRAGKGPGKGPDEFILV